MHEELRILLLTAASIGFIHTLLGPDHYLPFIVMAKAREWSLFRTVWITIACGIGHVGSSIVLGIIGVAFGIGVHKLVAVESVRGSLAAWVFIAFGLAYMLWGIRRAVRRRPHSHLHQHGDGSAHLHEHIHFREHAHLHESPEKKNITPWVLFVIFVLGPCEPLIPLLMYPAAQNSVNGLIQVSVLFSVITISTMLVIVVAGTWGLSFVPLGKLERFSHAMAGAMILLSGVAIRFMGL
jgi:nickel/cobalt exporter